MENNVVIEKKPNHYVGPDVYVTITTNDRGQGVAEHLKEKIEELFQNYGWSEDGE